MKNVDKLHPSQSIHITIYPNLWAPPASLLQSLTVVQQCVYHMQFRNVCKVRKWLVEPGLVWSRTFLILLSINGENVFLPVFAQWANAWSSFTAGSWKMDNWMKCQP